MDKFEKFISENKEEFDGRLDKKAMWDRIEAQLPDAPLKPKVRIMPLRWIAASAAIVLVAFFVGLKMGNPGMEQSVAQTELAEIDAYYAKIIAHKIEELESKAILTPDQKADFLSYLDELDVEYKELKLELNEQIDNQEVMDAIVENLRKRIDIIERFIELSTYENVSKNENQISL